MMYRLGREKTRRDYYSAVALQPKRFGQPPRVLIVFGPVTLRRRDRFPFGGPIVVAQVDDPSACVSGLRR
jgi:hypothetical protein